MKKKIITLLTVVCMLALAGCGQSGINTDSSTQLNEGNQQAETVEGTSETAAEEKEDTAAADTQAPSGEGGGEADAAGSSDTLVVYFSRTGEQYSVGVVDKGNTAIVADMIVEQTGADDYVHIL